MAMTISRILHAGYVFERGATRIAFDPIFENPFSRNCHAFPDVRFDHAQIRATSFDAVFISHFHDDHCSFESLDLIDRATPIHLYCLFDELFAMVRELGFTDVRKLAIDTPVKIGAFEVTPREALDSDVDTMFQISADGLNVLNVVDSWIGPESLDALARVAPWDMVLWPFQAMRETDVLSPARAAPPAPQLPDDWIEQLKVLKPRYVVPSSCQFLQEPWSWYNRALFPITYRQFIEEVEAALPETTVMRLNPSVSVKLDHACLEPADPLPWVLPVGEQDVDYRYEPGMAAPATVDIATRFAALAEAQAAEVRAFCQTGLPERYRSLELAPGSYFEKLRLWQLSVIDHAGQPMVYVYRITGDAIERIEHADGLLSWSTEVPLAKLYAALALGESLTSMYMRINDTVFDDETEAELANADITDDPLIRCLFDGAFGAYQAAQLRGLKRRDAKQGDQDA